jgi:hypothetical protein
MNTYAVPGTIATGSLFTTQSSMSNLGPGPADPTKVSFYLSADSVFTPGKNGDTLIGKTPLSTVINADASSATLSYNLFMPCVFDPGKYYLAIVADGPRELPETKETNNAVLVPFNSSACSSCSYSWNTGATGTTLNVSSTSSGTYNYTVTATNGCGTLSASKKIYYADIPTVGATANPTTLCVGDSITLSATGATTYKWTGRDLLQQQAASLRRGLWRPAVRFSRSRATTRAAFAVKQLRCR